VLTDNGTHFTDPSGESWSPAEIKEMIERKEPFRAHAVNSHPNPSFCPPRGAHSK
jgi:hypothetical protein